MNEFATFGAGCFWGVEYEFSKLKGVLETTVGYMGGTAENPTYEQVCTGKTGHAEVCRVVHDMNIISYWELMAAFFAMHDPTALNRQGPDVGTQYRSVIFCHDDEQLAEAQTFVSRLKRSNTYNRPIVTEIKPATKFWRAEEHHQKYFEKNENRGCYIR